MSDEKSFRERVEEIRQERASQDRGQNIGGTQQNTQSMNVDMGDVLNATAQQMSADRILIEKGNQTLEFIDPNLYKTPGDQPLFQILGTPDCRTPNTQESRGTDNAGTTTSNTEVFNPGSETSKDTTASSRAERNQTIDFCPSCRADLSSFVDPQFCVDCGREF